MGRLKRAKMIEIVRSFSIYEPVYTKEFVDIRSILKD